MDIISSIHPSFMIFELIVYFLFIGCFIHAWKRGIGIVMELLGGLLFGILLEFINVKYLSDYHYGKFLAMINAIPLCIGTGWAVIIYSSMALSDRFGFNVWTRPIADAFLALNIDLSMDVIAIRLGDGMWVWGWIDQSTRWTSDWFGVPFGNFFGWFFVVLLYSATVRTARYVLKIRNWNLKWKLTYPFSCVIVSELILTGLLIAFTSLWSRGVPGWLMFIIPVFASSVLLTAYGRPKQGDDPAGWIIHAVPLAFHVYFLISIFTFKIAAWTPWIPPISISMLAAGLAIQILAFRSRNKNRIDLK